MLDCACYDDSINQWPEVYLPIFCSLLAYDHKTVKTSSLPGPLTIVELCRERCYFLFLGTKINVIGTALLLIGLEPPLQKRTIRTERSGIMLCDNGYTSLMKKARP